MSSSHIYIYTCIYIQLSGGDHPMIAPALVIELWRHRCVIICCWRWQDSWQCLVWEASIYERCPLRIWSLMIILMPAPSLWRLTDSNPWPCIITCLIIACAPWQRLPRLGLTWWVTNFWNQQSCVSDVVSFIGTAAAFFHAHICNNDNNSYFLFYSGRGCVFSGWIKSIEKYGLHWFHL